MTLPNAGTTHELEQGVHTGEEEIRQLIGLLRVKETEEEERGSSYEEDWKESDLRAKLEEAEDRRMRAEEELKNLQSRVAEMENEEKVNSAYHSAEMFAV